jgi:hypothetical protein
MIFYFMKIEDKVQFTYISEVFIKNLNKGLHEFKYNQLILILINDCYEIETGVAFIDYFILFVINKVAHLRSSRND